MNPYTEAGGEYRASVYLTRRCDLRCTYCSVPLIRANKRDELSAEQWPAVINNLAQMGAKVIINTGGEPFLVPKQLRAAVRSQLDRNIYPVVLTNGRLIVESKAARAVLANLRNDGLQAVSVSIDEFPQPGSIGTDEQKKSFYGLRALDMAKDMGFDDLSFTTVLTPDNYNRVEDLLKYNAHTHRYPAFVQCVTDEVPGGDFSRADKGDRIYHLDATIRNIMLHMNQWNVQTEREYFRGILSGHYRNFRCYHPGHVVVAPDGTLQLCNEVRGSYLASSVNLAQSWSKDDLANAYFRGWTRDLEDHCPGCYMRCHVDYHIRLEGGELHVLHQ